MKIQDELAKFGNQPAPKDLAGRILDSYATIDSEFGPITVAWNEHGVSGACWGGEMPDTGRPLRRAAIPSSLRRAVIAELAGDRSLEYDLERLTDFERAVLRKALEIPRGQVRTYGWIAREIGRPKAMRAVGTALANNPIPFLIPCHRVVRSDGVIGEYGAGGPTVKRRLLTLEGAL